MTLPFTDEEVRTLSALLDIIVPPSATFDVPGAGDDIISTDILNAIAPGRDMVAISLMTLKRLTDEAGCDDFLDLPAEAKVEVAEAWRSAEPMAAGYLWSMALQCYYRDGRVMKSLAMEARSPFPEGFEVKQGNWDLLDSVKEREPFWREDRPAVDR